MIAPTPARLEINLMSVVRSAVRVLVAAMEANALICAERAAALVVAATIDALSAICVFNWAVNTVDRAAILAEKLIDAVRLAVVEAVATIDEARRIPVVKFAVTALAAPMLAFHTGLLLYSSKKLMD